MKYVFHTEGGRKVTVHADTLDSAQAKAVEELDRRAAKAGSDAPVNWGLRLDGGEQKPWPLRGS